METAGVRLDVGEVCYHLSWVDLFDRPVTSAGTGDPRYLDSGWFVITQRRYFYLGSAVHFGAALGEIVRIWSEPAPWGSPLVGVTSTHSGRTAYFTRGELDKSGALKAHCAAWNALLLETLQWAVRQSRQVSKRNDVSLEHQISASLALLGGIAYVPIPDGIQTLNVPLAIPSGTLDGAVLRYPGVQLSGADSDRRADITLVVRVATSPVVAYPDWTEEQWADPEPTVTPSVTVADAIASARPLVVFVLAERADGLSTGTGVVMNSVGLVVTNYHVVQNATRLMVQLPDSSWQQALPLAARRSSDVAVVALPTDGGLPIDVAYTEGLRVGDEVIALGYPNDGRGHCAEPAATRGIISRLHHDERGRLAEIQVDAAINPGNSGGALINTSGELLGIVYARAASPGINGIGWAIGVDVVLDVLAAAGSPGR